MEQVSMQRHKPDPQAEAGAAVYSKSVLSIYDLFVLGFSNRFAWKCPSQHILDFYNEHISANHLDVGVGTGYFLDKCTLPSSDPTLALLDLNPNSLHVTAQRLRRYRPTAYTANILEPLQLEGQTFDSVGMNYLLHCLPGTMIDKGVVFENLKPLLNANAVVFGSTILGQGVPHTFLARRLMRIYNSKGIFGNREDNLPHLEHILRDHFSSYAVRVEGCVAFFVGRYR